MKQFIFCDHGLNVKYFLLTDQSVKNFDCVTPQKTKIEIPLNYAIENNDIVIVRDQETMETEYIGIIDTVSNDKTTQLLIYPFENIFDNDCVLSSIDGDLYSWIVGVISDNFLDTGDEFNDYPFQFEDHITKYDDQDQAIPFNYKRIIDGSNLLDNLNDIFLNTGVFVRFSIDYNALGYPKKIVAGVYNANDEDVIKIRFDNPVIVDNKVTIESSHTRNYNKAIIQIVHKNEETGEDEITDTVKLYLKENNQLTTNPNDPERIKQVKPKLIQYKPSDDELTTEEQGEAIILLAEKALCGRAFDHSIEFIVVTNKSYDWKVNKRCDFTAENRIYNTYVTSVEYLSDKHARITLGAYRYTLTDRFKALRKTEGVANSVEGVAVTDKFENSMFWFEQTGGHLKLHYPDTIAQPSFSVDGNGHLIFSYNGEAGEYNEKYIVDSDGKLVYNL